MIVHTTKSNSIFTGIQPDDIQPNAIDVRVDKLWEFTGYASISDNATIHRGKLPVELDYNDEYVLPPGAYDMLTSTSVHMAADEAGWLVARSTLNRNGIFVTSGLYDSGYKGIIGGTLRVFGGELRLKKGTRVAQFVTVKAQSVSLYNGTYGSDKEHDKIYNQGD